MLKKLPNLHGESVSATGMLLAEFVPYSPGMPERSAFDVWSVTINCCY
jgi:hypothetical protein